VPRPRPRPRPALWRPMTKTKTSSFKNKTKTGKRNTKQIHFAHNNSQFHEHCKTTITSLLYISQLALNSKNCTLLLSCPKRLIILRCIHVHTKKLLMVVKTAEINPLRPRPRPRPRPQVPRPRPQNSSLETKSAVSRTTSLLNNETEGGMWTQ